MAIQQNLVETLALHTYDTDSTSSQSLCHASCAEELLLSDRYFASDAAVHLHLTLPLGCVDLLSCGCKYRSLRLAVLLAPPLHLVDSMKFGALLRNSAAELPELHQLFVSYKQLKKRLKRLPERQELVRQRARVAGGELPDVDVRELRQQEEAFVQVLDQDVQQFNR